MLSKKSLILTILWLFFSFQTRCQDSSIIPLGQEMLGIASFYNLPGQQTASGETMLKGGFTCAHRWYPFGTMLEVTNLATNKWVIVKVTDRGPFSGGRMLDLSMEAARTIGMVHVGIIKVKTIVVGDKGQIFAARSEPIIEKTMKESVEEDKTPLPILPPPVNIKKQLEQVKNVRKKRAGRRKRH